MRSDLSGLVADLTRGDRAGRPGCWRRAARIRAKTVRGRVRVALLHLNVRRRNAQFLSDDLRVGRLVSLPLRLGPEASGRLARRVHAQLARVEHLDAEDVEMLRRSGTNDFGEARNADAHQLATRTLLGLLLAQVGIADLLHRFPQRA